MRLFQTFAVGTVMFGFSMAAHAAGFAAELKITDGKTIRSDKSKPPPRPDQLPHRVTLQTSADAPLTATWTVTRTDALEARDTLVHFVVVRLDRPGQAIPRLDPAKVPIESALTMDFPRDKAAHGLQPFRISDPGVYLVRIEAGGDPDAPGQEDFAELELVVK